MNEALSDSTPSDSVLSPRALLKREWPYLLVLVLTLFGIAYASFSRTQLTLYWIVLAPLIGVICVVTRLAGYPRSGRAFTPGMDASIALGSRASGDASHVRRRRCKNVECGRQCPGRAHSAGARDVHGRHPYWVMADLPRRPDNGSRGSRDSMARTIGAAVSVGSACSDCGHRAVGLATATGA